MLKRKIITGLILLVISAGLCGCFGEKRIDASSEEALQRSLQSIMETMNDAEKEKFQDSLKIVMFSDVNNFFDLAAMAQSEETMKAAFFAKINNKTASEINQLADARKNQKAAIKKPAEAISAQTLADSAKNDAMKDALESKLVKKEVVKGRYSDGVSFEITFRNTTSKDIKGAKGIAAFNDIFGDEIYSAKLSMDDTIKAGQTYTYVGGIELNQFMAEHNKLQNTPLEKIQFEFTPQVILFTDGTDLRSHDR